MLRHRARGEARSPARIRAHYEVEKRLASRLKQASREERRTLYALLYDEMYRQIPDHPQLTRKASPERRRAVVRSQMRLLARFLDRTTTFLEVGAGDCALALEVARVARKVYAVDVSRAVTGGTVFPENFELILSDGCSIPVPPGSVDVAYSNQLMEHLHPDDALEQLENIYRALAPGGVYLCITPNRLDGPHDVSRYFDEVATGFHLKEYTISELAALFRRVGFERVSLFLGARGKYVEVPAGPSVLVEASLSRLPSVLRRRVAGWKPVGFFISIRMLGRKRSEKV